jgi:molybdate transport system substrate-binding protein
MTPRREDIDLRRITASVVLAVAMAAAACGDGESSAAQGDDITIFAASSLTDAFTQIGKGFESNHDASVTFNFLASSDLATQIQQGADADVFASADEPNMETVVKAGLVEGDPRVFVHNILEIVVRAGNPARIRGLQDLRNDDLVVSLCAEECPAGRYALQVFDNAGVQIEPDSLETEVKGVVARVASGEADAGIVYATDIEAAAGIVEGVEIPEGVNVVADYPIATLKGSPAAAAEFVDYVVSVEGRNVLRDHGFRIE